MKQLTDRQRHRAMLGMKPLPARYRVPPSVYWKFYDWLFQPDPEDYLVLGRDPLGIAHSVVVHLRFHRLLELLENRARRWCYKHQAHKNSWNVAMKRMALTDQETRILMASIPKHLQLEHDKRIAKLEALSKKYAKKCKPVVQEK